MSIYLCLETSAHVLLAFILNVQQLDGEVEDTKQSWETLRGAQYLLEVPELRAAVDEEQLSQMLKLHGSVKTKICGVESILELTSRFHHTARQVGPLGPAGRTEE